MFHLKFYHKSTTGFYLMQSHKRVLLVMRYRRDFYEEPIPGKWY